MSVLRAFIAISLSEPVYQSLEQVISGLHGQIPTHAIRWTHIQNIHLTLKFLGNISAANVDQVKNLLEAEASRHAPFEISVGGLGAFPNNRRPRVVWVGIQAPETLYSLQKEIENGLERLGYPPEEKRFSPHLTLGRTSRNAASDEIMKISEALAASKIDFLGLTTVQAVSLYLSDLQPGGAIYTRLASANLGAELE